MKQNIQIEQNKKKKPHSNRYNNQNIWTRITNFTIFLSEKVTPKLRTRYTRHKMITPYKKKCMRKHKIHMQNIRKTKKKTPTLVTGFLVTELSP